MPIHLRAEMGDYAPAVLLPGDPLRARRVAEEFLEDARQVNGERGMLGYTGSYEGQPVSVQATGMGCPSAAIVIEELALSAVPADATSRHYTGGEPHAPTAHFGLTHGAIHAAKGLGIQPRVGAIASSDTFYDPDPERHLRWAERGVLAVEMEAAVLFTIGALRSVKTACILTVSDLVGSTQLVRIADDELALGVERMTRLALAAAVDAKA